MNIELSIAQKKQFFQNPHSPSNTEIILRLVDEEIKENANCFNSSISPETFFEGPRPEGETPAEEIARKNLAISICERCVVREACLIRSISYGDIGTITGGMTTSQRSKIANGRNVKILPKHPDPKKAAKVKLVDMFMKGVISSCYINGNEGSLENNG